MIMSSARLQNASSVQKDQLYFYTSNKQSENEIIKTFPLNNSIKKNKIGRNFNKRSTRRVH